MSKQKMPPPDYRVKYFLDTEFAEAGDTVRPISIALVSESGREYYAECDTDWRSIASPWVMANVAPYLEGNIKPISTIRDEISRFVGDMPAVFWAFCAAYDWVMMCQIMGEMENLPASWLPVVMDLIWMDPERTRINKLITANPKRHHALWDARELREQYRLLTQQGAA